MKPRIAIPVPHSDLAYSGRNLPSYTHAVKSAGGEAVEIPLTASNAEVAHLIKTCGAVLLPGSPADVDPQKYGAAARHPKTAPADPSRDNVDELLLQDAHNMRKPILGICYGLQSLNVWRQGTLVQHIESPVAHSRPQGAPTATALRHTAEIEPGSKLGAILGGNLQHAPLQIVVNSSHHQAIETPGDGLRVAARSPEDQVIEAVEGSDPNHWVIAVQWHPERSYGEDEPSRAIFHAFIDAARQWHARAARSAADFETVR
ncbi:MAG TPA: gamma-glutamyl-gamma-aminobutyrate hydrolase family protein [Clostridia bacterium]|nr:gamma-glutamyl-gamma-aminobutyrate hydrolase family protein [Clostridia bacterium]